MNSKIVLSILIGFVLAITVNCKKETSKEAPTLTTASVTNISSTSLVCGGEIKSDGGAVLTALGVCWGTNQNPTVSDNKTIDGIVSGLFSSSLSGLNPGTTYYIRAYATNSVGTSYGNQVTTTTTAVLPSITTAALSAITSTTAISGGNIANNGGSAITARGICWSTNQNPTTADNKTTDGTGTGLFISLMTGLKPGSMYYVRSYATNSVGTVYGDQVTAETIPILPTITTAEVSFISTKSAQSGGDITSDGGGAVTAKGVCWSVNQNPTIFDSKTMDGAGKGIFSSSLSGLISGNTYYVRAYATNSQGTAYGNQIDFQTKIDGIMGSVADIDGNNYATVTIGTQVWMAENLKVTRYNDGTAIPLITDNSAWSNAATPGYCWYNNDESTYRNPYGALYNWYTVNTGKLCPTGWHVPTDAQWTILTTYLGDLSVVGGKLKETGTLHWNSPNTGATNEINFSAIPGGYRTFNSTATCFSMGIGGSMWSSTSNTAAQAWERAIGHTSAAILVISAEKGYGVSVRCVED